VQTAPACSPTSATTSASAPDLKGVSAGLAATGGSPFGVFVAPGGKYYLVTVSNAVAVLRAGAALHPRLVRTILVPGAGLGGALTRGGRFLLAATGSGATVIDVAAAEDGAHGAVVGTLTSPHGSGAVEVFITPDNHYAFVSLQNSSELAVFNLQAALKGGFTTSHFIGYVPVPAEPVGMTSDGTWLYVASLSGKLSVISLARAEHNQAHAVVAHVAAGCGAARAMISRNHQFIWVTDRQADALLAFSVPKLRTDQQHALQAKVMVGVTPVGETFVDGGDTILVADANLNDISGAQSTVAVVSVVNALTNKPALLGYLPVGSEPRQFAVAAGGRTALLTLQGAHRLEAIAVRTLPGPPVASGG
jgi:DNA-binding beta-propeller fold protein YncE